MADKTKTKTKTETNSQTNLPETENETENGNAVIEGYAQAYRERIKMGKELFDTLGNLPSVNKDQLENLMQQILNPPVMNALELRAFQVEKIVNRLLTKCRETDGFSLNVEIDPEWDQSILNLIKENLIKNGIRVSETSRNLKLQW